MASRLGRLQAAAADLTDLTWDETSLDCADEVIAGVESVQRTLSTVGCQAIARLRRGPHLGRGRRLRDHLANGLHVSATEAGKRSPPPPTWPDPVRCYPRRQRLPITA